MYKIIFSANMRHLRGDVMKIKQAEMPSYIGIPKSTWNNYETGASTPNLNDLVKISEFFGLSEYDLLHTDLSAERPKVIFENDILTRIEAEKSENMSKKRGNNPPESSKKVAKNIQNTPNTPIHKGTFDTPYDRPDDRPTHKKEGFSVVNEPAGEYKLGTRYGVKTPAIVTINEHGIDNILYVPVKARAGYLLGYGDPEFIETLPSFRMPGLSNATYRMFEVEGQSMAPTLSNSDRVICEWVPSIENVRDGRLYVVLTRDGVLIKRVINRLSERNKLYLKSDTIVHRADYPLVEVDVEDIVEIWYVRLKLSSDLSEPAEIYQRVGNLEVQMHEIMKVLRPSTT